MQGKEKWLKGSVIKINQDLYNKGTSGEEGGLALNLVLWLSMGFSETATFEVDASLKWMHPQSKLKSGTSMIKQNKTTVRAHHSHQILAK